MLDQGDSQADIEAHLSIYRAIRDQNLSKVLDTVERVLGRKPLSFDEWVKENVSLFERPGRSSR
jgi:hypothetical protein